MSLRKSLLQPNASASSLPASPEPTSPVPTPSEEAARGTEGGLPALSNPDATFCPSEAQSRAKARFWARRPTADWGNVPTVAEIKRLTNSSAIERWVRITGFMEWFLNGEYVREKASHLMHLALSAVEDVLLNTDPKAQGARISAAKQAIELNRLLEQGNGAPDGSDDISKMSRDELISFLKDVGKAAGLDISIAVDATQMDVKAPK